MGAVDRVLAELAAEGDVDSRGEFTMDRARAREKMRQFQLEDPRRYVLELVQAAVIKGATGIRFDIDADDMRMAFDGEPFTVADFEQLYGSLFSRGKSSDVRGLRQLALGLNAAMALNPRWIQVVSRRDGKGAILKMRPGEPDAFEDAPAGEDGTRIHVKGRFRPGLVVEFLRNLSGAIAEERILRDRCIYCPISVDLEGTELSHVRDLGRTALSFAEPLQGEGFSGVAGFHVRNGQNQASLRIVIDGVWITSHFDREGPHDFVAVVHASGLKKDLSQGDVVKDGRYEALAAAVRAAQGRALRRAWERHRQRPDEVPFSWIGRVAAELLGHVTDAARFRDEDDVLASVLADIPLWATTGGSPVSMRQCMAEIDRTGRLAYSEVRARGLDIEPYELCLFFTSKASRAYFRELFGSKLKNLSRTANRHRARSQRHVEWRNARARPVLGTYGQVARVSIEHEGYVGELAIARNDDRPLSLRVIVDGCELYETSVDVDGLRGLEAVIEGPFNPTRALDRVRYDKESAGGVDAVVRALGPLLTAAGEALASARFVLDARLRFRLLRYLDAALDPELRVDALRAFGIAARTASMRIDELGEGPVIAGDELARGVASGGDQHALAQLPLFPAVGRGPATLLEIAEEIEGRGRVRAAFKLPRGLPGGLGLILCPNEGQRRILERTFGAEALEDFDEGLVFEAGKLAHRRKPREAVRLRSAVLASAFVEHGKAEAHVGVPLSPRERDADGRDQAFVRLLKGRRHLGHGRWPVPVGPLIAVVDDPGIEPNGAWDGAADGRALAPARELLGRAAGLLLREVAEDTSLFAEPAVELLRRGALALLAPTRREPADADERAVLAAVRAGAEERRGGAGETIAELLRRRVHVQTWRGGTLDLGTLADAHAETGRVAFARRTLVIDFEPDGPVAFVDDDDRAFLEQYFGADGLQNAEPALRLEQRRLGFEARRAETSLELPPSLAFVSRAVDEDGIQGTVGLRTVNPPGARMGTVSLHKQMRRLAEVEVVGHALVGRINCDALEATEDFQDVVRDGTVERIERVCRGAACEIVADLARRWDALEPVTRGCVWPHVLDVVRARVEQGALAGAMDDPVVDACARVPAFTGVDGQSRSLADLLRTAERHGAVFFVAPTEPRDGPHDMDPLPVVAGQVERELLEWSFPTVVDYGPTWRAKVGAWRHLAAAPPLPRPGELPGVARIVVDIPGLRGELVVPDAHTAFPEIQLGVDGKSALSEALVPLFPCTGVLEGPGLIFSDDLREAILDGPHEAELEALAITLYDRLLDAPAKARPQLERVALRLHHTVRVGACSEAASAYYERIAAVPLWTVPAVGEVSLEQLLEIRPAELDHLGLWVPSAERRPAVVDPPQAKVDLARPQLQVEPEAEPDFDATAPVDEPTSTHPVADAVAAHFRAVRAALAEDATLDVLDGVSVGLGTGGAGEPVLEIGGHAVLNTAHPLVARVLERCAEDPVEAAFLATLVFAHVHDSTELADHVVFHMAQLDVLRGALG